MAKAVALLFIVMIGVATTMINPIMASASYNCPPGTPTVPSRGSSPGAGGKPGGGSSPGAGGSPGGGSSPGAGGRPGGGSSPGTGGRPGGSPGAGGRPGRGSSSCPLNAVKLGACLDLLGGLVHLGIGDPVVNQCCPVIQGVLELEAALCLCTTIRLKLLNLNVILPLALELFVQCGMTPPPGFKCPPLN